MKFLTKNREAIEVAAGGFHGYYRIRRTYATTIHQSQLLIPTGSSERCAVHQLVLVSHMPSCEVIYAQIDEDIYPKGG